MGCSNGTSCWSGFASSSGTSSMGGSCGTTCAAEPVSLILSKLWHALQSTVCLPVTATQNACQCPFRMLSPETFRWVCWKCELNVTPCEKAMSLPCFTDPLYFLAENLHLTSDWRDHPPWLPKMPVPTWASVGQRKTDPREHSE